MISHVNWDIFVGLVVRGVFWLSVYIMINYTAGLAIWIQTKLPHDVNSVKIIVIIGYPPPWSSRCHVITSSARWFFMHLTLKQIPKWFCFVMMHYQGKLHEKSSLWFCNHFGMKESNFNRWNTRLLCSIQLSHTLLNSSACINVIVYGNSEGNFHREWLYILFVKKVYLEWNVGRNNLTHFLCIIMIFRHLWIIFISHWTTPMLKVNTANNNFSAIFG